MLLTIVLSVAQTSWAEQDKQRVRITINDLVALRLDPIARSGDDVVAATRDARSELL